MISKVYTLFSLFLLISIPTFYFVQNSFFVNMGGGIAFVKALWLGLCIYYWFFIPTLVIYSQNTMSPIRVIYKTLLFLMLFRLVVELYLMFVAKLWHPYMGLSHNALCLLTLGVLLYQNRAFYINILYKNMLVAALIFIPESFFAWYMLENVRKTDSMIFYVPDTIEHQQIIVITWLVAILLILWQIFFARSWVYKNNESKNKSDSRN